jgi:hypothetical protein
VVYIRKGIGAQARSGGGFCVPLLNKKQTKMITEIKIGLKKSKIPWLIIGIIILVALVFYGLGSSRKQNSQENTGTILQTSFIPKTSPKIDLELAQTIRRYFETEPGWENYAKQDTTVLVAKYLAVKDLSVKNDDFTTAKILLTVPGSNWTLKEIEHYLYLVKMIED